MRYIDFPNNSYHCTVSKITFINITMDFIKKVFKYWEAVEPKMTYTSHSEF